MTLSEVFALAFGTVTLAAAFRTACPLLLAGISGSFSTATGTFNIAFECFMLCGAFFGAYGSHLTSNPYMGGLMSLAVGLIMALLFGFFVFVLRANAMIVSVALNFGAWAITTLLLTSIFGSRGRVMGGSIVNYPIIHMGFLEKVPVLNAILNDNILLVYVSYLLVIVGYIVMYKTPFGLQLRGIGINPVGAETVGVHVQRIRWITLLIMGAFAGLAGSYLSIGGLALFSENMTSGRGFLAFAAILIGDNNPFKVFLACFLFAYTYALTAVFTAYDWPTQLVLTLPYVAVILALFLSGLRAFKGKPQIIEL